MSGFIGNGPNNIFAQIRNILGFNRGNQNNYNRCMTRILTMEDAYMQIISGTCKVLDVRSENEYKLMRIKGAINIPINILSANVQNILTNKSEPILVYCANGQRAAQAVQILKSMGYMNICIWEGAGISSFKYKDIVEKYNDNNEGISNGDNNNLIN